MRYHNQHRTVTRLSHLNEMPKYGGSQISFYTQPLRASEALPEFVRAWDACFAQPKIAPEVTAKSEHLFVLDLDAFRSRLAEMYSALDVNHALPYVRKGLYGLKEDLGTLQLTTAFDEVTGPDYLVLRPSNSAQIIQQDRAHIHGMIGYLKENAKKDGITL